MNIFRESNLTYILFGIYKSFNHFIGTNIRLPIYYLSDISFSMHIFQELNLAYTEMFYTEMSKSLPLGTNMRLPMRRCFQCIIPKTKLRVYDYVEFSKDPFF